MRMPDFWRAEGALWPARLLTPFAAVLGTLTLRRMARTGFRAPVPVVAIGNFTAGGAGKTPATIALAEAFSARGERPFVIMRGHGGRLAGPVAVDPRRHAAETVGDEALLLARAAPVIVARDRAAGARRAVAAGATLLLLDDALQNPHLIKDLTLALIDGAFGFGNGRVIPAGPLRAPLEGQWPQVDCAVIVGPDTAGIAARIGPAIPLHPARLEPAPEAAARLAGVRVLAFSGIGLPEKFEASLRACGAEIAAAHRFGDHHRFTPAEARRILAEAEQLGARPVTTEKDHVRLGGHPDLERLAARAEILPVTLRLAPETLDLAYRAVDSARSRISTASGPA
ncbi:tetraacyldisaccharide 4'-kinase [Rhabdaerophilum calidifontis]|uniref:tetraacyldisaccharide 4'-kinase n=1 Tax=Rhabdaerophilum calidifontis TaxID=2604328 RepID=UPI00123C71B5|nr:tetraacyldisaccharide 4'-kinase [Rhabdaerophilum calidifontis]